MTKRARVWPWCVVNRTEVFPSRRPDAVHRQRVEVPSRKAPERRVAGPRRGGRPPCPERGVKSLYGGSNCAGRNMK